MCIAFDALMTLAFLAFRSAGIFLAAGFCYEGYRKQSKHDHDGFAEREMTNFVEHFFVFFECLTCNYRSNTVDFQTIVEKLLKIIPGSKRDSPILFILTQNLSEWYAAKTGIR
ncbi:MAG: hypothetical protein FD123_3895 [Bacteroidetes bacterium]|nr:MAG: hypothetical protein FD123_3895 [Bacteroidota bacterium]